MKSLDIYAITVFLFSTLVFTEIVKILTVSKVSDIKVNRKQKQKKRFIEWIKTSHLFSLILSWLIGILCFLTITKLTKKPITESCILQYTFWMVLLNGGYKVVRELYKKIKNIT